LYCVVSMWRSVLIPRIDALDRVPLFRVRLLFSPLLDLCLTGQQSYHYQPLSMLSFLPDEIQEHQSRHEVEVNLLVSEAQARSTHLQEKLAHTVRPVLLNQGVF
jgi:hypothetical protein